MRSERGSGIGTIHNNFETHQYILSHCNCLVVVTAERRSGLGVTCGYRSLMAGCLKRVAAWGQKRMSMVSTKFVTIRER